jgi:hypothetical protein
MMLTFHEIITFGATIISIIMSILVVVSKNKREGYKEVIFGFILIAFGGIITLISKILRLWPLSVLYLILSAIVIIFEVGGLYLLLKNYMKRPKAVRNK